MKKSFLLPILSLAAIVSAANGYAIFEYDATNTTTTNKGAESKTSWNTDVYINAYGDATHQNPTNPFYTQGKLAVDEGVLKLKGVTLPTTGYPGAFLAVKSDATKIIDCTGGFSYWYKGDAHWFLLNFDFSVCDTGDSDGSNKWGKKITAAAATWTKMTVTPTDITLANTWTGSKCTSTNAAFAVAKLNKVSDIVWGFDDKQTGTNLMIGDIVCLGGSTAYVDKEPAAAVAITTGCFAADLGPCAPASSSSGTASGSSSSSVAAGGSSSSVADGGSSSSNGTAGTSSSSGADAGGSSSSVDDTPIISHNSAPVVGLNMVNFARSLRIASDKNATLSLFDINGKLVLSQKVLSGTSTISLANQKVGVYYAVAKSSSHKQIIKIVLK